MLYGHDYGSEEMRDMRIADVQYPTQFEVAYMAIPPQTEERPWELATAFDVRDDAHITVAAIWRSRRQFAAVGWETRLISAPDSDAIQLQVRPREGCARPTYGTARETPKWTDTTVDAYREALGLTDDDEPIGAI
jgi:hypothetical protein